MRKVAMKALFELIEDRFTKEEIGLFWGCILEEESKITELIETKRQEGYKYGYEDGYEEGHEDGYEEAIIQR